MWLIMTNHVAILQRIFHRQCRSFGQYLAECWPWTHRVDREAQDLVRSIITDERRWAERLAELITERGGVQFTDGAGIRMSSEQHGQQGGTRMAGGQNVSQPWHRPQVYSLTLAAAHRWDR